LISSHHILGLGVWKPKATTLFHTLFQRSMKKKKKKLFIAPLMNTNIKLGEGKNLKDERNKTCLNPIVVFIHIQSLE
jgi:hypothetical protein